jgi:FkbM family methyltransferase
MSLRTRLINALAKGLNENEAEQTIRSIANSKRISLLYHAFRNIGIHNCNDDISGEFFFINEILRKRFTHVNEIVFFDVGANIGSYTKMLSTEFPNAFVHAFEPVKNTFEKLQNGHGNNSNIFLNNAALSNLNGAAEIYHYNDRLTNNEHGTIHKEVLSDLFSQKNIYAEKITLKTLDEYCDESKIEKIHFLKIDTEGHEFKVLQGAERLLNREAIDIIQFEFNEMNIISRVFLKDFYELLKNFSFFRLNTNELIPLENYNSINEIFQFQNIVAIKN